MIYGIDVSNYQAAIDMAKVRAAGIEFVIAKIGQGAGKGDKGATFGQSLSPAFGRQRDAARANKLLFAGYWYIGNGEAPANQAKRCKAALGDPSIAVALDWEDAGGTWANYVACIDAFRGAGIKLWGGYVPNWYGSTHGMPAAGVKLSGLPLWCSRYRSMTVGTPAALLAATPATYWDGYAGSRVTVLQFTSTGQVAGMTVDVNAYQGTYDQLAALLGANGTPSGAAATTEEDENMIQSMHVLLPAGKNLQVPVLVPPFVGEQARMYLGTGWSDAQIRNAFFIRDRGPGLTPAQEQWGGTGQFNLGHDDRPWWPLPSGTTQISIDYDSDHMLSMLIAYQPIPSF